MAKAKDLRYAAYPIPLQCWSQVQINDIYRRMCVSDYYYFMTVQKRLHHKAISDCDNDC